mmetsp:Transcript_94/g.298  ORF Transcript_94/g.298 Transcript_94/m.298 type:complete len:250 (-) Transcript_94:360-1109(-)
MEPTPSPASGSCSVRGLQTALSQTLPAPLRPPSSSSFVRFRQTFVCLPQPIIVSTGRVTSPRKSSLEKVSSSQSWMETCWWMAEAICSMTVKPNLGRRVRLMAWDLKFSAPATTTTYGSEAPLWKGPVSFASKSSARSTVSFRMPVGRGLRMRKTSASGSSRLPMRFGTTSRCAISCSTTSRIFFLTMLKLQTAVIWPRNSRSSSGRSMKQKRKPWKKGGCEIMPTSSTRRTPRRFTARRPISAPPQMR